MPLDQPWEDEAEREEALQAGEKEMTFLEHLEELRWHLLRSGAAILVFTILGFIFHQEIFRSVILAPKYPDFWTYRMLCKLGAVVNAPGLCVKELDFIIISRDPTGQFMMAITYSIVIGLVVAFPYIFWELWRFITPGLKREERRAARGGVFWVSLLFFTGVAFGYYVVAPLAINFLANFKVDPSVANQFDISSYISLLIMMVLACGLTFQLPVVAAVLSQIGLLTPAFMREYRRHAFLVILVIAAIITPSPDVFSQLLVAAPLYILYEISIGISGRVNRRRLKELDMNPALD
jgi:sec-independent protein translocase protein TatC